MILLTMVYMIRIRGRVQSIRTNKESRSGASPLHQQLHWRSCHCYHDDLYIMVNCTSVCMSVCDEKVTNFFWKKMWKIILADGKIILAGGKTIFAGGKIILAGGKTIFCRWENYFGRWENYFGRWENYFCRWENYFGGQSKRALLLKERAREFLNNGM